jgi:hypothetical protein
MIYVILYMSFSLIVLIFIIIWSSINKRREFERQLREVIDECTRVEMVDLFGLSHSDWISD